MELSHSQLLSNTILCVPNGDAEVFGWFDAKEIYRKIFDYIPNNGWFCEIGVFLGKSTIFFQKICAEHPEKTVNHLVIDTFEGTKGEHEEILAELGMPLKDAFIHNLKANGVDLDKVFIKEGRSQEVLLEFPHRFFDAVYIDGDHSYEAFRTDLKLAKLKTKKGGIIAGHDIDFPSIWRALKEEVKIFEWDKKQRSFIFQNV